MWGASLGAGGKGTHGFYLGIVDEEQLVVGHIQSWQLPVLASFRYPLQVGLRAPKGCWPAPALSRAECRAGSKTYAWWGPAPFA